MLERIFGRKEPATAPDVITLFGVPEDHVLKYSVTFGQYNMHRNKQGVLVLDDEGQAAMKEAHAWQAKHFPKATRGSWGFAKNE